MERMEAKTARILADHSIDDFVLDVKITEILKMPYRLTHVSTMTTMALELDSQGSETILIISCLNTVMEYYMMDESGRDLTLGINKLRQMFDEYLVGSHIIYLSPMIDRHSDKINKRTQAMDSRFRVSQVEYLVITIVSLVF